MFLPTPKRLQNQTTLSSHPPDPDRRLLSRTIMATTFWRRTSLKSLNTSARRSLNVKARTLLSSRLVTSDCVANRGLWKFLLRKRSWTPNGCRDNALGTWVRTVKFVFKSSILFVLFFTMLFLQLSAEFMKAWARMNKRFFFFCIFLFQLRGGKHERDGHALAFKFAE